MESDNDSYYEEISHNEEVAAPPRNNLEVNLEESPESPQASSVARAAPAANFCG